MAQLKEDEWPGDKEQTTTEQEVARDRVNGPKDPHDPRKGARQGPTDEDTRTQAQQDTDAAKPRGRT
jgi:hypothetical protein